MNKFDEVYTKILNECKSVTDIEQDFINNKNDNYEVISEDILYIINEYVKDPELTPVPKEYLNIICSRVKFRRDNVTIISMKELYNLLREYEYPFYQEFKQNLGSFSGNLYIVMLFDRDYEFLGDESILQFNSTYQFLFDTIKDKSICNQLCNELLKEKYKDADALCSKTDNDLKNNKFFQENCLIYVSLKTEFIKDSLEHELTHFVQKTVGFNKTENKIKEDDKLNTFINCDKKAANNLLNWIKNNITNDQIKIMRLMKFFSVKFKSNELHESIKAVLNGFQRIYEYGKFKYINKLDFSTREINQNESKNNIQFRLNWLNIFFNVINSNNFIKNDLSIVILNLFNEQDQQQYLIKYRSYFIVLLYFGFKYMFKNLNIDNKLKEHFETFKYRDN